MEVVSSAATTRPILRRYFGSSFCQDPARVSNRLGCGDSSFPVAGLATTMHHGNNKDELRFDGVQNSIRKDVRETAANIVIKDSPTLWGVENSANCILNGLDEPRGKGRIALGVIESCLLILLERLRVESISHRRTISRTFWRASSPGMVSTLPLRTSSRLRFASATHSWSIGPSLSPSKLSTRRSASRARDSVGRFMACSASCSTVVAMTKRYPNPPESSSTGRCHASP